MAYSSIRRGKNRIDIAESMEDVISRAETESPWKMRKFSRDSCFTGQNIQTASIGEAIGLARMGWPEGRDKLSANLDAAKFVNVSSNHKAEDLDVAGAYPIVPAFIAGAPDCMVSIGLSQSATKPIYRFIVNLALSCTVNGNVMARRGAAILSWVDRLESEGARCEVVAFYSVSSETHYTLGFTIKRADEPLDLDRMAFALVNPSMTRRIIFGCYESIPEDEGRSDYGVPSDNMPEEYRQGHSIYFKRLLGGESEWSTPAKAVAAVEAAIIAVTQHDDLAEA